MITDEILFLVREYKDRYRGNPDVMVLNIGHLEQLKEELGLSPIEDLTVYQGMDLDVREDAEEITLFSFDEI